AASEARYMHDILRKMLKAPVFLDSSVLSDLRNLITEGVHKSDSLVLLVTRGVFSRPWCLLELLEVARKGIPVVMVQMANCWLDLDEARGLVDNLEAYLHKTNPAGLQFLQQKLGPDLTELKEAVHHALGANKSHPIVFSNHAGDKHLLASMKDVVEQMASVTRRPVRWEGNHSPSGSPVLRRSLLKPRRSMPRGSAAWDEHALWANVVNYSGCDIFVCCSREDATAHAQLLCSELEVQLERACAIGGGCGTHTLIEGSQLVVVLLTGSFLCDPASLFESWKALQYGLPLVTVAITGVGYDCAEAAAVYSNLRSSLDATRQGAVGELEELLPDGVSISNVGEQLYGSLTAIIAFSRLRGPYVVPVECAFLERGDVVVVQSPCYSGGNVRQWCQSKDAEVWRLRAAQCIAEAVRFLHAHGVLHRDLKHSNSDVIALCVTLLDVLFCDGDEERLRHMVLGSARAVADLDDRERVRGELVLRSDNEWRMGWLVLMCAALGLGNVTGAIGAGRVSAPIDTEHSMNFTRAALKVTQKRNVAPFDLLVASSAAFDRGGVNCKAITLHHKTYMQLFCSRLG
ncbi:MAG: hypothetical protein SGPRY_008420, partial [Prymnesium sp.]